MAYHVAAAARGHGTWPGPYAGAAVGAMFGPCRRRASGDAAVARVVGCCNSLVRTMAYPIGAYLLMW